MAINKVGSKGIIDGSVAAADFGAGAITNAKLADGAVTNAKLSNSSITVSGTSVALGASGTLNNQFVDWQSVITSNTTMVAGRGYFVNTTSGAISMTLPASATIGDLVVIKDYAGTFATNKLTILRNSHNIQGIANDSLIQTNRASIVLVYVDATKGWLYTDEHNVADLQAPLFTAATGGTVATSGDFKIHTFTGDGNFVVSQAGNAPIAGAGPASADYLVVAGGGAGAGSGGIGGGAGAGGYRTSGFGPSPLRGTAITLTATTFPITVGGGAAAYNPAYSPGSFDSNASGKGSNSVFSTITSTGGGGGGVGGSSSAPGHGGPGGSAGGGNGGWGTPGGNGNTPPVSPSQGNNGGTANDASPSPGGDRYAGGGGGGSGAAGSNGAGPPRVGGAGGAGVPNTITGSDVTYAGGGGGGGSGGGGSGGAGGGGDGNPCGPPSGNQTASVNTGGGGGGGGNNVAGAGGKGIVVIRYKFQ